MDKETFDRMLEELQYITEKVTKIREFIMDSEKFEALDYLNRDLLITQCKAMETYLSILSVRLGINGKPVSVEGEADAAEVSDTEATADSIIAGE